MLSISCDNVIAFRNCLSTFGDGVLFQGQTKHYSTTDGRPRLTSTFARIGCIPDQMFKWSFYVSELLRMWGIRAQGLLKMQRQHVHLHHDLATASAVGTRHGKLAMLQIRAGDMHRAGLNFYLSANGVWLSDAVPAEYIAFPA